MHSNVPLMLQIWLNLHAHCMQSKALLPVFICTEAQIKKNLLLTGLPRLDLCTTYCIAGTSNVNDTPRSSRSANYV